MIQNGDSSLLYKTYNPVEVNTAIVKEGQPLYVLKEDITTEESLYEYLIYDAATDILYDSDVLAILDSISSSDIAATLGNNKELEYKADDIDLKSNKLRIVYKSKDKIKYIFLDLTKLGTPLTYAHKYRCIRAITRSNYDLETSAVREQEFRFMRTVQGLSNYEDKMTDVELYKSKHASGKNKNLNDMNQIIIDKTDFDKVNLEESHIQGFHWCEDQNGNPTDLEIEIDWNGPFDCISENYTSIIQTRLCCQMVYDAQFNFEFRGTYTIGDLEITSFNIEKLQEKAYCLHISFDFAPIGYIRFKCTDFRFVINVD